MGLWIYNLKDREAFKVLGGPIGRGHWAPDRTQFFFSVRGYHRDIWVADMNPNLKTVSALGPGRTKKEHCQELIAGSMLRLKVYPKSSRYIQSLEKYKSHLELLETEDEAAEKL